MLVYLSNPFVKYLMHNLDHRVDVCLLESNGTAETVFDGGISNKAFGTQSIKKKGSTVDYSA